MEITQQERERAWLLAEKYQGSESAAFAADCLRLAAGEPLAYLIGHTPFLNTVITLDSHPLIPRPETEFWVEQAVSTIKEHMTTTGSSPKTLDLCAGSGAIGVAVAKALPLTHVTLAELDTRHLPTIKKNISDNLTQRESVAVVSGDLFSELANLTFDFILTNPPYIDATAHTVDDSVALHEPHLALFGGVAGLEIIARIIAEAPSHLTECGELWIEHEPFQSEAITKLAQQAGFTSIVTHPDQYGVLRFSVLGMSQY